MNFSPFCLHHFPGARKSERPLLPRRAGALWEGPVPFGRNRKSRSREAAGRRNWPEAVPRKMSGRKREAYETQWESRGDKRHARQSVNNEDSVAKEAAWREGFERRIKCCINQRTPVCARRNALGGICR